MSNELTSVEPDEIDAIRKRLLKGLWDDDSSEHDDYPLTKDLDVLIAAARDNARWWRIMDAAKEHGEIDPRYKQAWELIIALRGADRG